MFWMYESSQQSFRLYYLSVIVLGGETINLWKISKRLYLKLFVQNSCFMCNIKTFTIQQNIHRYSLEQATSKGQKKSCIIRTASDKMWIFSGSSAFVRTYMCTRHLVICCVYIRIQHHCRNLKLLPSYYCNKTMTFYIYINDKLP